MSPFTVCSEGSDDMDTRQTDIANKNRRQRSGMRFNRMEFSGSLGDVGTLLPMGIGMILINGLDSTGMLVSVGLFYILSGLYFGVPVSVQPMKVIGAYALSTAMRPDEIAAAGLMVGFFLMLIGVTNAVTVIGRYIPKSVVRGVQLSTGALLMAEGVKFMVGTSGFQLLQRATEPYLVYQQVGPVPIGIILGITGGVITLLLLENKTVPAGLAVVTGGMLIGGLLGTHAGMADLRPGFYLPGFLPFGWPRQVDFAFVLFALAVPQLPMTLGNAVVAQADLSREYFGDKSRKVTYRSLTVSMGLANFVSCVLGGMPLCHGAGGLAAHYRFGARTGGSNLMIGGLFLLLGLFLGPHAPAIFYLLPMSVLGVLLLFSGSQLALTLIDIRNRQDLFVALLVLGVTLASNLAAGFLVGIAVASALKSKKLSV